MITLRAFVFLAALAVALPAAATPAKNKLEVTPVMFRTYVRMHAFYEIAPDEGMERICAPDAPAEPEQLCDDYREERARLTLTIRRNGKVLYDETKDGVHGVWEQRVRFRALQNEAGPDCAAGFYYWTIVMPDPVIRESNQAVARRGRWKLRCERGQLVAVPDASA